MGLYHILGFNVNSWYWPAILIWWTTKKETARLLTYLQIRGCQDFNKWFVWMVIMWLTFAPLCGTLYSKHFWWVDRLVWTGGWIDEHGWMDRLTDLLLWVDVWMGLFGWVDGLVWRDGWMDGLVWRDGLTWLAAWRDELVGWSGGCINGWLGR